MESIQITIDSAIETIAIDNGTTTNLIEISTGEAIEIKEGGTQGASGVGVVAGGSVGQVLAKIDGDDFNTRWVDPTAGSGYDDTLIQVEVDLNTAKVSNIDHPLVEVTVPLGAVFTDTDTVYDDTAISHAVAANTAKVSNIDHPLVERAVPGDALFTDTNTVYDDTVISQAVAVNTAKVSNVSHPLVEKAVPLNALFTDTDTVYDDSALVAAVALNTSKQGNVDHPLVETAVPAGALFTDTDTVYDDIDIQTAVALNTAKVSNISHPLVEKAVPSNAVFTDTDTVYDDTAIQAQVDLNTARSGGGGGSVYSFNRITGAGTQAITSTLSNIVFSQSVDSYGSDVVYNSAAPTRLTAQTAGVYKFGGVVTELSSAQRAQASCRIRKNGALYGLLRGSSYIRNSGTSWDYWALEISSTPITLAAGDYIEISVAAVGATTYGGSGSVSQACHRDKTEFWLERMV